MKIYTSYYAKARKIPDNIVRISIAGKAPAGYTGLEYKNVAPKIGFFLEWKKNKDKNRDPASDKHGENKIKENTEN